MISVSTGDKQIVFLRYWGSFFKSPRIASEYATIFRPMVERGWETYLVLGHKPADLDWLRDLTDLGVHILEMPRARTNFDWDCIKRIRALCRSLKCDIFHCDNMHTSPLLGAYFAGVPVRVWCKRSMNAAFEECRELTVYDKLALTTRLSCALATKVITVSHAVKSELVELGISEGKFVVQNNPRRNFIQKSEIRDTVRQSMGYSKSDVVIATTGHAVPVKGWDILLKAFARIAAIDKNARLLLIGSTNGDSERAFCRELKQFVESSNLTERVTFPGHIYDISKILPAADIFVLPSRSEGCANVLIEALDLGLPCVASRVGNAEDVIQSDSNGFVVERNNAEALENALRTLVSDEDTRARFAAAAKLPSQIPTLEEYSERLATVYESLLKKGRHCGHHGGINNITG